MDLGSRPIDLNFNWVAASAKYSDEQIKGFEKFASKLKSLHKQPDSHGVQAYFPTGSQAAALNVLRDHISKGPRAPPLYLVIVGQGGCG